VIIDVSRLDLHRSADLDHHALPPALTAHTWPPARCQVVGPFFGSDAVEGTGAALGSSEAVPAGFD
jgi:hypothetical protein